MNTPGVARGNWRVRFKKEQLDSLDTAKYAHWNHMYAR
jgi:4-alpha-glucanotransferase